MTLVAVNPFSLYGPIRGFNTSSSNLVLDAPGEKVAWIGQAPSTGTIDLVGFRTAAVTTGAIVDVTIETLGADTNPSGTLLGANTSGSVSVTTANTWYEVTLTAGATVTQGDMMAVVISLPEGSTGNLELLRYSFSAAVFPVTAHYTVSWSRAANSLISYLRYSDTSYPYVENMRPAINTTVSYNTGITLNERGAKITVPFNCKVKGIWFNNMSISNLGNFDAVLYNSSNDVLASASIDGDMTNVATSLNMPFNCLFNTDVTLSAGQVVRATRKPTTTTNITLGLLTIPQADLINLLPGGSNVGYTTRSGSGEWTDTSTIVPAVGLIVSAIDNASNETTYSFIG